MIKYPDLKTIEVGISSGTPFLSQKSRKTQFNSKDLIATI